MTAVAGVGVVAAPGSVVVRGGHVLPILKDPVSPGHLPQHFVPSRLYPTGQSGNTKAPLVLSRHSVPFHVDPLGQVGCEDGAAVEPGTAHSLSASGILTCPSGHGGNEEDIVGVLVLDSNPSRILRFIYAMNNTRMRIPISRL